MKMLIVEDDFTSRVLLQELLKSFGAPHVAVNGVEAVKVCEESIRSGELYELICLDIMMPEMDGYTALREIRKLENEAMIECSARSKIVMTTALGDVKTVMGAFHELCDGYLVKPYSKEQLDDELKRLGLI